MADAEKVVRIRIDASGAEAGAKRVTSAISSITRQTSGLSGANDNAAGSMDRLSRSMAGANTRGREMSGMLNNIRGAGVAAAPVIGNLVAGLAAIGPQAAGITAVAVALAGLGTAAAKYQDVLAKISTNVDTTKFSMAALSDGILKQSAAFGGMPVAQAEAAYDIISAGAGSAAQALDILNASNQLAVGGMTSVGVAADGLTSVINAYGADVLTTTAASDAMFVAARDGKTTIDQLSSSLGNVAPLAAAVGVSFDEVTGAIGVLTKGGIKTAESVTGLRAILSAVSKPSEEAKKAAKSLGLEFSVAGLKAMGLRNFLQEVAEKTGHSTAKMATLFGGVEALVPALALTSKNGKEFAATMDNMANKAGSTQAAVQKMADGSPSFQWSRVLAGATAELIKIGNVIASAALPVLRLLADNMENIFRVAKAAAIGLATFGAAAVGMKLASSIGQVIALQRALGATGTFSALFGAGMKIAQAGVNGLTAALALNPFTAIAVAITATIALLYQFRDSITISADGVTSLGDFFSAVFESIGPAVSGAASAVSDGLSTVWAGIQSAFGGAADFLYSVFQGPLDAISGIFESTFGDLDLTLEGVAIGAARVADLIVGVFRGSFYALVALWNGLPDALGPNIMAIVKGAKALVVGLANGISGIWKGLVSFGQSAASALASAFNSVASFIERWANKAINAINDVISGANKLGAGLTPLANITIGKIAAPAADPSGFAKLGQDMGTAFAGGFDTSLEDGVTGLMGRARAIGAERVGAGSSGKPAGARNPTVVDDSGFSDPKNGGGPGSTKAAAAAQKSLDDFWQSLKDQAATAALLTLEAANHAKKLELQKILGKELTAEQKAQVDSAMQLIRTNKFLADAKQASIDTNRQAGIEEELTRKRIAGMTEDQLDVERKVLEFRNSALAQGIDLQGDAFKAAEAQLRIDQERLATNKAINDQLSRATDLADKYSATFRANKEALGFQADREAARTALDKGQISPRVYEEILAGIHDASLEGSRQMKEDFGFAIEDLGNQIKGKWGRAISGIGALIQNMVAASRGDFGAMGPLGAIVDILTKGFGNKFEKLGEGFKDAMNGQGKTLKTLFGEKGGLVKGLGQAMGGAAVGQQVGSITAGLGKMISSKFSKTGSELGGALGGAIGSFIPGVGTILGSIGGSLLGGVVGGLFKKTKRGFATINSEGITSGGNNKAAIDSAVKSGNSITDTLARIAGQFGGSVGNFGNITIGTRKDAWRVNGTGTGLKVKQGAKDFGKDGQEEAIRYALSLAIERGAITGIRASTNALLKAGKDIEAQVDKALRFENVFKNLAALKDPVKAAADALNAEFKGLANLFKEAGASAAEYADLEEYRSLRMQELIKQETSTLRDILRDLNGEAGGKSPLALLQRDMAEFAAFQSKIANGQSVNQDDYSNLVNNILSNASIYGSNSVEFQNIISQLRGATQGAINNIEGRIQTDPTTSAVIQGTNSTLQAIGTTNDILARIEQLMMVNPNLGGGFGGGNFSGGWSGINGQLVASF